MGRKAEEGAVEVEVVEEGAAERWEFVGMPEVCIDQQGC